MLYDERAVRDNIRNRGGKRVIYLDRADRLTPSARDFLTRSRIEVLSPDRARPQSYRLLGGGRVDTKPEHMTALHDDLLVPKTHPRIGFRGAMDTLQSELLWCRLETGIEALEELLALSRRVLSCEVMDEPLEEGLLCGLTQAQQREKSHLPQVHFGIAHFMPEATDGRNILALNRCRCAARAAELAACRAFTDREGLPTREDLLRALNRMSSMLYILMLQEKAKG